MKKLEQKILLTNDEHVFLEEAVVKRMGEIEIPDVTKIRVALKGLHQYVCEVSHYEQHMFNGHIVAVSTSIKLEELNDFLDACLDLLMKYSSFKETTLHILETCLVCLDKLERSLKRTAAIKEVCADFVKQIAEQE